MYFDLNFWDPQRTLTILLSSHGRFRFFLMDCFCSFLFNPFVSTNCIYTKVPGVCDPARLHFVMFIDAKSKSPFLV